MELSKTWRTVSNLPIEVVISIDAIETFKKLLSSRMKLNFSRGKFFRLKEMFNS